MQVKEIVYLILDLVKGVGDDFTYTEDHVLFLCKKYRSLLVKKEQEKDKGSTDTTSEFEYQQICLDLEPFQDSDICGSGYYLRSTQKIPSIIKGITPRIYPIDYYQGANISFVSKDKMKYVGNNRYLKNIIYCSIGPDFHLYVTSSNPQFKYLRKLRMNAVFDDIDAAASLYCDDDGTSTYCDVLEMEFPIRDHLVPALIDFVVKELVGASYRPIDKSNNSNDDLADIASFIRRNVKSPLQKQIED